MRRRESQQPTILNENPRGRKWVRPQGLRDPDERMPDVGRTGSSETRLRLKAAGGGHDPYALARREADVDPVGGAVAVPGMAGRTAGESGGVDQGLCRQRAQGLGAGPVGDDLLPCARPHMARGIFDPRVGQDQETGVADDTRQMPAPGGVVPTDPTIPRP